MIGLWPKPCREAGRHLDQSLDGWRLRLPRRSGMRGVLPALEAAPDARHLLAGLRARQGASCRRPCAGRAAGHDPISAKQERRQAERKCCQGAGPRRQVRARSTAGTRSRQRGGRATSPAPARQPSS